MNDGLKFLQSQQLANGGFSSHSSPARNTWQCAHTYQTTFVPALILNCLADLPEAKPIRNRLSRFLQQQKSATWSFNYWDRGSAEMSTFPYPDDLDDTFCALIGLFRHNPKLISEPALVQIIQTLIATETTPGGPYRTWLATTDSPPPWQNVDLAVNANIAYFLQLIGSSPAPLQNYLKERIVAGDYTSIYYPTPFPIWYYLARVCPADYRQKLISDIRSARVTEPLHVALSLTALYHLGTRRAGLTPLARRLQASQRPDGSWPAQAYCIDPSSNQHVHFHGSPALTTAFALEALNKYQSALPAQHKPKDAQAASIQQAILAHARHDIANLSPEVRRPALAMLAKLGNPQITLLAYNIAQSLVAPANVSKQFYVQLGLANLYGWIAYTIYDDFLDEEGTPAMLPLANIAHRYSLDYFRKAMPGERFQMQIAQTFTIIDQANAWEIKHCRTPDKLPRYGQRRKLAERSLGHLLTPLAVLVKSGQDLDTASVQSFRSAFQHYLIVRQLNDDAHDWQADYAKGHNSYVVSELLKRTPTGKLPTLQREFWHHTLPAVCRVMQGHLQQARTELNNCAVLKPANVLSELLDDLEISVQQTLTKQAQAKRFLKEYRGKSTKLLNSS